MNSSIPSWLSTNTFVAGPQNFRKALLRKSSVTGQSSKPLVLAVLEFPTQVRNIPFRTRNPASPVCLRMLRGTLMAKLEVFGEGAIVILRRESRSRNFPSNVSRQSHG